MTDQQLINVENINALELFTEDGIDPLLKAIETQVADFVPDLETLKGRHECASMAHKVSKAKIVLDNAGKNLVAGWKEKAKVVDDSRKHARAYLDDLRDRVRRPLTEWEAEQERIAAEKKAWDELEYMQAEAIAEDFIFERERKLKAREAELEKQENDRLENERIEREAREAKERKEQEARKLVERLEREEKERAEREERIKRDAEERAQREHEEELKRAQDAADKAERYLKEQADRAVKEKERAEREKKEAIEKTKRDAKREAQRREDERLEKERQERQERDRKAANVEHRRTINNKIMTALDNEGFGGRTSKKIVTLIATGTIPYVSINY